MRTKHVPKMWLVKREVIAGSIREAASKPGRIYEITEAEEKNHPLPKSKKVGFNPKTK